MFEISKVLEVLEVLGTLEVLSSGGSSGDTILK